MSWLKEVEASFERKKKEEEEAKEAERLAEEREYQKKKSEWDAARLTILSPVVKWDELDCDRILKSMRGRLWPESRLWRTTVRVQKVDGEVLEIYETEYDEFYQSPILGGLLGSSKKRNLGFKGRWEDEINSALPKIASNDIADILIQKGISPNDVAQVDVSRKIYHEVIDGRDVRNAGYTYSHATDFRLTLCRDHAVSNGRFVIKGIDDTSRLQEAISQYLLTNS